MAHEKGAKETKPAQKPETTKPGQKVPHTVPPAGVKKPAEKK